MILETHWPCSRAWGSGYEKDKLEVKTQFCFPLCFGPSICDEFYKEKKIRTPSPPCHLQKSDSNLERQLAALYFSPDITRMVISLGSNTDSFLLSYMSPRLDLPLSPGIFQICAVQQILEAGCALCQVQCAWTGDAKERDRAPEHRAYKLSVGI